jgi:hypothetical protein
MILLGIVGLLAGAVLANDRGGSGDDRTWAWNLREQGCAGDNHEVFSGGGVPDARVAFGSNEEIVVLCHSQSDPGRNPYEVTVHALAIETISGRVSRTLDWTGNGSSAVFPTITGNYAILRHGTVLYGPGLGKEIARSPHGVMMISPGGGRFVASTRPVKEVVWVTMDAATLTETGVLRRFYKGSISDTSVADLFLGLDNGPFIRIETDGREPVDYVTGVPAGSPAFVSDNTLLVVFPDRFELISTSGARLLSGPHGYQDGVRVTASRDGRRMAITHERYSGHWSVIKYEEVTVYDLESVKPIWTFKHRGMKGAFSGHSDMALSPDGSLLAIKWPGTVRLFRMPEGQRD